MGGGLRQGRQENGVDRMCQFDTLHLGEDRRIARHAVGDGLALGVRDQKEAHEGSVVGEKDVATTRRLAQQEVPQSARFAVVEADQRRHAADRKRSEGAQPGRPGSSDLPADHGAPVVADQVDRFVHLGSHQGHDICSEPGGAIAGQRFWGIAGAEAEQIRAHYPAAGCRQGPGLVAPEPAIVRTAMQQDHKRAMGTGGSVGIVRAVEGLSSGDRQIRVGHCRALRAIRHCRSAQGGR